MPTNNLRLKNISSRFFGRAKRPIRLITSVALLLLSSHASWGQATRSASGPTTNPSPTAAAIAAGAKPFKKMSLDELMNIEVTSVTRGDSTVGRSPAAITVISQDDIRRSGATSIPEALRMAPGLEVAQIDNSTWGISARGFNSSTANKLLVLMDGRSVYTPLYSGVFWDVQDTLLQDVERIEVIRGPTGALWGANAVNGVINIITKDAKDTQGVLFSLGGGTELRNYEALRYGWQLGDDAFARVYVKHFERDETVFENGAKGVDDWSMTQSGFRIDWRPSLYNHGTIQGDIYQGDRNNPGSGDTYVAGGNLLGRWTHQLVGGGDVKLQMYVERTERDIPSVFKEDRNTFDFDFQHRIPLNKVHELTWGLGYRVTSDNVNNSAFVQFIPDSRTQQLISAFIQDEIQLVPDKLRLTIGSKFEENDYTGFEVQPNARLLWTIDKRQTAWAAVSRAVRTPSRIDEDLAIVTPTVSAFGSRNFESEEVIAYELGYRVQPVDWLALDVSTFYNNYDNLRSLEFVGGDFIEGNKLNGQTYGVELGSTVQLNDWWTLRGAYTYLQVQLQADSGSTDFTSVATAGDDPQNQVYLRSSMDLPHHLELDCAVRYVSELTNQNVPGYVALDVRLAWHPNDQLELAIVGQNLLDERHPEFGAAANRREIERSVYTMLTCKW
jgi:iron complex outermembrane receptor protein